MSFLIDNIAPLFVLAAVLIFLGTSVSSASLSLILQTVACLGLLVFGLWNSGYQQGRTGQSIGRRLAGTQLVSLETGAPVGFGMALTRQLCHLGEAGIGFLWPLGDEYRQTFADKMVRTVVVQIDG